MHISSVAGAPKASNADFASRTLENTYVYAEFCVSTNQVGVECPDQPYQAMLTVLNTNRKEVLQFETEEDGRYIVSLPPGDYILRPESPQDMPLPYASEQYLTVLPDKMTQLIVTYDSGIR